MTEFEQKELRAVNAVRCLESPGHAYTAEKRAPTLQHLRLTHHLTMCPGLFRRLYVELDVDTSLPAPQLVIWVALT